MPSVSGIVLIDAADLVCALMTGMGIFIRCLGIGRHYVDDKRWAYLAVAQFNQLLFHVHRF